MILFGVLAAGNVWGNRMEASIYFQTEYVKALQAVDDGREQKARTFLDENGLTLNVHGHEGITPLFWLLMQSNEDAVALALKLGANPNFPDGSGDTPITVMAGGDDTEMLQLLLEHGGDPNSVDRNGKPALFSAISQNRWDNLEVLLEHGADPDQTDRTDKTSVQYAAILNRFEAAHYLIERGADYQKRDAVGGNVAWEIHDKLENNLINPESEAYDYAHKVKQQLKERGVEFPPPSPHEIRVREGRPNRWDRRLMEREQRDRS